MCARELVTAVLAQQGEDLEFPGKAFWRLQLMWGIRMQMRELLAQWPALNLSSARTLICLLFWNLPLIRWRHICLVLGQPLLHLLCNLLCCLISQDSVWGMNHSTLHSVFQTNQSNNQQSNFEAVQSGKKKKKQKMVRADPSLLGEYRPRALAGLRGV